MEALLDTSCVHSKGEGGGPNLSDSLDSGAVLCLCNGIDLEYAQ